MQKETKIKTLEGNQNKDFRMKLIKHFRKKTKIIIGNQNVNFGRKPKTLTENGNKILEGNQIRNFKSKPKILKGNQNINFGGKTKI